MCPKSIESDVVIINSNVVTLDPSNPRSEALAIKDGKILAVGKNDKILQSVGDETRVLDLVGKTVLPGFVDTHVHLTDFGLTLKTLDVGKAVSINEVLKLLEKRVRVTPKGEWVMGRGWNENKLAERRLLNRWDLDEVSPNHPVYLHHYTCHACVVNSKGLEVAKIDRDTEPPQGGWIDKDPGTGEPTGFLRSNARRLVPVGLNGYRPLPDHQSQSEAIKTGLKEAVKNGLTGIQIASAGREDINILQKLAKKGELPLRVTLMPRADLFNSLSSLGIRTGLGDEWVKLGALKIFSDGSLIAHTAAMTRPFEGEPENVGLLRDQQALTKQIIEGNRAGMQLALHACGDRAVGAVLDAYEEALKDTPRKGHRHRIEHGSVIPDKLKERIKNLGVIVSTQPELVTKYGDGFQSSLGPERMRSTYAYKTLLDAGIVISGSSDCPLTYCSPLKGVQAAVARTSENTGRVISKEERISIDDAIRMYTINAAYAGFEEKMKGTIEEGKLADLVVLAKDPWSVSKDKIGDIVVEVTIVGGKIVYKKE